MWKWHVVYEGNERPVELEIAPSNETRKVFKDANTAGACKLGERVVVAMWVIDLDSLTPTSS